MRTPTFLSLALVLPLSFGLGACGGGDSVEGLASQQIDLMEDFSTALSKVTDKASAEKQRGALEAVATKMADLKKKVDALPEGEREPSEALQAKLEPEMKAAMMGVMKELARLQSSPELIAILEPALEKMPD